MSLIWYKYAPYCIVGTDGGSPLPLVCCHSSHFFSDRSCEIQPENSATSSTFPAVPLLRYRIPGTSTPWGIPSCSSQFVLDMLMLWKWCELNWCMCAWWTHNYSPYKGDSICENSPDSLIQPSEEREQDVSALSACCFLNIRLKWVQQTGCCSRAEGYTPNLKSCQL